MSSEFSSEPMGILVLNKCAGVTSHDMVSRCRKLFSTRKIGHTGTLDPMATGVLVILVGRAVKASEYLTEHDKAYVCTMRLGLETDTEDVTGTVLSRSDDIPGEDRVLEKIGEFTGEITQIPPMYSALKVNGRKLVDLARRGIEVEREPRKVRIGKIEAVRLSEDTYRLYVECSKGTYIRTLCADIGRALGCGAAMGSLERISSGAYTLDQSVTAEELEGMAPEERTAALLPVESAFADLPAVRLDPKQAAEIRNGMKPEIGHTGPEPGEGSLVTLFEDGRFFALGRVLQCGEGTMKIKQEKLFVL